MKSPGCGSSPALGTGPDAAAVGLWGVAAVPMLEIEPDEYGFGEFEPGLCFGSNRSPVDGDLPGDPYHFAVHIVAKIGVEEDMVATFEMGSDDDSWAFIDGALEGALAGLHALEITTFDVPLAAGIHDLERYMAERHTSASAFWFR